MIDEYFHHQREYYTGSGLHQDSGKLPEALRDLICFMLRDDRYQRPQISIVADLPYSAVTSRLSRRLLLGLKTIELLRPSAEIMVEENELSLRRGVFRRSV